MKGLDSLARNVEHNQAQIYVRNQEINNDEKSWSNRDQETEILLLKIGQPNET